MFRCVATIILSDARESDEPAPQLQGKRGPVVVASTGWRKRLGEWLAKLREQAGVSTAEAAGRLGYVESTLRHWEAGRSAATKIELEALLDLYEAPWDVREQLERIREDGAKWQRWASYRLPACFAPDAGFEAEAAKVCAFALYLVPGLLQTDACSCVSSWPKKHCSMLWAASRSCRTNSSR